MRLRKSLGKLPAQSERHLDIVDRLASDEGRAIERALRIKAIHITSSVAWAPKKPSGKGGWLRMSEARQMRGQFVRGQSNRTPKLWASFIRAFDASAWLVPSEVVVGG
jgi:hypothetical protein